VEEATPARHEPAAAHEGSLEHLFVGRDSAVVQEFREKYGWLETLSPAVREGRRYPDAFLREKLDEITRTQELRQRHEAIWRQIETGDFPEEVLKTAKMELGEYWENNTLETLKQQAMDPTPLLRNAERLRDPKQRAGFWARLISERTGDKLKSGDYEVVIRVKTEGNCHGFSLTGNTNAQLDPEPFQTEEYQPIAAEQCRDGDFAVFFKGTVIAHSAIRHGGVWQHKLVGGPVIQCEPESFREKMGYTGIAYKRKTAHS
jgi:hypothetical protein